MENALTGCLYKFYMIYVKVMEYLMESYYLIFL